jgi:hypothetical protein
MVDDIDSDSDLQNRPGPKPANGAAGRFAESFRPLLDQAVLNLRVWLPALNTPDMKGRQVKYRARENRTGLEWHIKLPEQCWQCGKTDSLAERDFKRSIQRFDSPLSIIFGSLGVAGMLLLPWLIFGSWKFVGLAILPLIGGGVLLKVKSWPERVRLMIWTCPQHAAELSAPAMAIGEDDLYLFVASESLAEAARAELKAARRRDLPDALAGSGQERPARAVNSSARERAGDVAPDMDPPPPLPTRSPPVRAELPPLKLAGDEDEPSK